MKIPRITNKVIYAFGTWDLGLGIWNLGLGTYKNKV